MQIGPNPAWNIIAIGRHDAVEWTIPRESMAAFDAQFRSGAALELGFLCGNEAPWSLSLSGSSSLLKNYFWLGATQD